MHPLRLLMFLLAVLSLFMPACQAQHAGAGKAHAATGKVELHLERVDAVAFKARLDTAEAAQFLDVRSARETASESLAGAVAIDVLEDGFAEKAKHALDAQQPVYVYCRSGNRSQKAAAQLQAAGFRHVVELSTGILGWKAAGFATVKP